MDIKCFDIVDSVVQEACDRFKPAFKLKIDDYNILRQYCDALDIVKGQFDTEYIDVSVDEIHMTISISIGVPEFTIENSDDLLYKLIYQSLTTKFSVDDEGLIKITLVFPSLWEKY